MKKEEKKESPCHTRRDEEPHLDELKQRRNTRSSPCTKKNKSSTSVEHLSLAKSDA